MTSKEALRQIMTFRRTLKQVKEIVSNTPELPEDTVSEKQLKETNENLDLIWEILEGKELSQYLEEPDDKSNKKTE